MDNFQTHFCLHTCLFKTTFRVQFYLIQSSFCEWINNKVLCTAQRSISNLLGETRMEKNITKNVWVPIVAQWVKDLTLSLWGWGFYLWPVSVGWVSSMAISCGKVHKCSSYLVLMWLWCKPQVKLWFNSWPLKKIIIMITLEYHSKAINHFYGNGSVVYSTDGKIWGSHYGSVDYQPL